MGEGDGERGNTTVLSSVHGAVMRRRGLWERERGREGRLTYYGFKLGARCSDAKERLVGEGEGERGKTQILRF